MGIRTKGVETLHYLDDFLLAGAPTSNRCEKDLEEVKSTCEWLGIPLAMEKVTACFLEKSIIYAYSVQNNFHNTLPSLDKIIDIISETVWTLCYNFY